MSSALLETKRSSWNGAGQKMVHAWTSTKWKGQLRGNEERKTLALDQMEIVWW